MPPKISVILPVWNGEKYLRAAVESILAQTFAEFELLAIDDGSTDGTLDVLESYSDSRIRIFRLNHGGIVTALNAGVAAARAEWIARQDADDVSYAKRFAVQMEAVAAKPESVLCYSDVSLLGQDAAGIKPARFPRTKAMLAVRLCWQNPIVHSAVLFRKDAFLRAGGYIADERHAEDFALWGRMLELGDFVGVAAPLLQFRVHAQSVSKGNRKAQDALTAEIALQHCQRFMRLTDHEARRAFAVLSLPARARTLNDWCWFLQYCVPRLPWHSNEARSWLAWQTVKQVVGF